MLNKLKNSYIQKIGLFLVLFMGMFFFALIPMMIFKIDFSKLPDIYYILYQFICDVAYMGIVFMIYKNTIIKNLKDYFKKFSINFEESFKYYFIGLLIMIGSNLIITLFFPQATPGNEETLREYIDNYPLYMIFATIVNAPFIEELIFRKSMKDIFLVRYNNKVTKYLYILCSGLLFGSLHVIGQVSSAYDLLFLIPYCSLGIVFAMLYYKTDNIFSTISVHFLNNFVSVILYLFTGAL